MRLRSTSLATDHLREYLPFGVLFLLTAAAQAALAVTAVVRPRRSVLAAMIVVARLHRGLGIESDRWAALWAG
ncbi:MAG: hypothetical protein ACREOY_00535 [Candidatus Dormibacteraceae bacterium]